jgi:outer membrane protein assembly factor BamB
MHHCLNSKTRVLFLAAATAGLLASAAATIAADWPMFGRDRTRNPVSPERNAPISWDIQTGRNIHWKARIGRYDNFATPVVANGLVWIGTNNENPRDPAVKGSAGVLMCFRESTGEFLYQHASPARQGPTFHQARTGISCSPLIEGDRLWFVTTSAEVICLDIGPLHRGEGLPTELWKVDMMDDLGVYPRHAVMGGGNLCSISASYRDLIYVNTGNGTDWNGVDVPSPLAPALLCLNRNTGKVVWEDSSPGGRILFAEWGNPVVIDSPIYANGALYAAAGETLYAIKRESSGDWPQWRGPDRSNASTETGLLKAWPTNGPPLLWKATGLGTGIASVSVADGQVYTMGYRDGAEFVFALEAGTGAERWVSRVGPEVKENPLMRWMTQRTPTVDEDRVYTMSASGELICLRTMDGRQLWRKSYPNEFLSPRRIWGFSDYPLVDGENLICTPVGPDATVVALNKRTGEVKWKAHLPGENAGYAATVISEGGGIPHYVVFLARSLVGINTRNGTVLWQYARPTTRIASSYSPIVHGEFVFSPNGYAGGMALLKLVRDGDGISAQEQYHRKFNFNAFQDCTTRVGDHVYSFQSPGQPVCINLKTGELAWGPALPPDRDRAALTSADGHLYIRRSSGAMILAEANPSRYVEKGSFQIPDREEASGVTSPVVAGGRLYLRDNNQLFSYDVSADALRKPAAKPRITVLPVPSAEVQTVVTTPGRTGRDRAPDAIFVPTPEDIVEKMLELAALKKEDTVYALGSGDGRIVIAAAAKYGCQAVGYEIDPRLVELSRERVAEGKVEALVRIEHEDMFTRDLGGADVVVTYLPSPLMERLLPQFEKLKPGSRIVSHQFEIPGVRPEKSVTSRSNVDGDQHRLFLWTTPLLKSR